MFSHLPRQFLVPKIRKRYDQVKIITVLLRKSFACYEYKWFVPSPWRTVAYRTLPNDGIIQRVLTKHLLASIFLVSCRQKIPVPIFAKGLPRCQKHLCPWIPRHSPWNKEPWTNHASTKSPRVHSHRFHANYVKLSNNLMFYSSSGRRLESYLRGSFRQGCSKPRSDKGSIRPGH